MRVPVPVYIRTGQPPGPSRLFLLSWNNRFLPEDLFLDLHEIQEDVTKSLHVSIADFAPGWADAPEGLRVFWHVDHDPILDTHKAMEMVYLQRA